jgi:hypothetical protein
MRRKRTPGTLLGAVVLTFAAAASAIVVNAGILRDSAAASVGSVDPTAVTASAGQSNVRYVTVYVDDPTSGSSSTAAAAAPAATVPNAQNESDHEYEGAQADD